ncbi:aminotransferase class I/II-fold pyridoxal phosphate-dependent enzyme [Schinkia sp. CFF1]
MNDLAIKLNDSIKELNPFLYSMLSDLGRRIYYPKGILSQSAEAKRKATQFNATIGIATEKNIPMHFQHIQNKLDGFAPEDVYPYAPPDGKPELRVAWREKLVRENPSLQDKSFSLPIVTNALTHGLSIAADLFVNSNDIIVVPDKYWGNYSTIFHVRRGGNLVTYKTFDEEDHFNAGALRECLFKQKSVGKAIVLLNFPNNPTGYTPSEEEAEKIISVLYEVAEEHINLVVVIDDAYFGLFYENSVKESLFGRLAGLHPRILPIKIDGATKENFVWGLRVGFITFAAENPIILKALEQKTKGLIRGTISSCSHLSQTVILQSLQSIDYEKEKKIKFEIMKTRALKVKQLLNIDRYQELWSYYPFNSGYFMCLKLKKVNAEDLRQHLLAEYGVGTIAINSTDLRIAFSCVDEDDLAELFERIYKGAKDFSQKKDCFSE